VYSQCLSKVLIFIILELFGCDHQLNNGDLQKYSYLLYGFYNIKHTGDLVSFNLTQGTGFFIKNGGKLFLISAKHVLTPCDPIKAIKRSEYPDTMWIRLTSRDGGLVFRSIDITRIRDTVNCGYGFIDPDVFIVEFKDTSDCIINSIESLIGPIDSLGSGSLYTYGFRSIYNPITDENLNDFKIQKSTLTIGSYYGNSMYRRKLQYLIKRSDTLNKQGCSGSPIFIDLKNKGQYRFAGILVQSDTTKANTDSTFRLSSALKSEFVLERLSYLK